MIGLEQRRIMNFRQILISCSVMQKTKGCRVNTMHCTCTANRKAQGAGEYGVQVIEWANQ